MQGGDVGEGEEGMRAAFPCVDAGGAEAPFAIVAAVAFVEAVVGEGGTGGTEGAALEPARRFFYREFSVALAGDGAHAFGCGSCVLAADEGMR